MNDFNSDPEFGRDFREAMEASRKRAMTNASSWAAKPMTLQTLRAWHVELGEEAIRLGNRWLAYGLVGAASICLDQAAFHKSAVEVIDLAINGG